MWWVLVLVGFLWEFKLVSGGEGCGDDPGTDMNLWCSWGKLEGKGHCYIHKQRARFVHSKYQMKICQLHLSHHNQMKEWKEAEHLCLCVHRLTVRHSY